MLRKSILPTLLVISFFALGLGTSQADEVNLQGHSAVTFTGTGNNTLLGLTYTSTTFNTTTAFGWGGLSLGVFSLAPVPGAYGGNFSLAVTFTTPTGIAGGNTATFTANVFGFVSSLPGGGVHIDFDNTPQTFSFSNDTTSGFFNFLVNDISNQVNQEVIVTGLIRFAEQTPPQAPPNTVPEPSTLLLLGTGLVGLARVRNSNTKKKSD